VIRSFQNSDQYRGLICCQFLRCSIEKCTCARLNTKTVLITKINRIEIHHDDFFLGIIALQMYCRDPFLEFLHNTLERIPLPSFRKKVECKLLSNSTSPLLIAQQGVNDSGKRSGIIDAGVAVK